LILLSGNEDFSEVLESPEITQEDIPSGKEPFQFQPHYCRINSHLICIHEFPLSFAAVQPDVPEIASKNHLDPETIQLPDSLHYSFTITENLDIRLDVTSKFEVFLKTILKRFQIRQVWVFGTEIEVVSFGNSICFNFLFLNFRKA